MTSFRSSLLMCLMIALAPSAAPAMVTETIGAVVGQPGGTVPVSVTMDDGGASVAAIQLDLGWDPSTPVAATVGLTPDCSVNPDIHKDQTVFAYEPFGCTPGADCTAVRALIISFFDPSPIATGSVLVTCNLALAADASGGAHPLTGTNCVASDAAGIGLPTSCNDGSVTVETTEFSLLTGKQLRLAANPTHPTSNVVNYVSGDATLTLPGLAEDPRCAPLGTGTVAAGATLQVVGAATDVAIALPCANWSRNRAGNQLTYRDRSHATCDSITMKNGSVKAACKGAHVTLNLGPPQGDVAVVLTTGGSASQRRYCASFGAATGAKIVRDGADGKSYVARNAGAPDACPP